MNVKNKAIEYSNALLNIAVNTKGERTLRKLGIALAVTAASGLSACGTLVPEIQDFGNAYTSTFLVDDIGQSVTCEVRDAFIALYNTYPPDDVSWLDNWGAQIDLTLTVNEDLSVVPATQFFPIGQSKNWKFNWGINGTLNSSATRTEW